MIALGIKLLCHTIIDFSKVIFKEQPQLWKWSSSENYLLFCIKIHHALEIIQIAFKENFQVKSVATGHSFMDGTSWKTSKSSSARIMI